MLVNRQNGKEKLKSMMLMQTDNEADLWHPSVCLEALTYECETSRFDNRFIQGSVSNSNHSVCSSLSMITQPKMR